MSVILKGNLRVYYQLLWCLVLNINQKFCRDTKNLTNDEIKMLLELSYNFDDEIVFNNEDNTYIKVKTIEE